MHPQESLVNQAALDVLRSLPGVTDANWRPLVGAVSCLRELVELPLERLEQLMGGGRAARALHDFLHAPCPVAAAGGLGAVAAQPQQGS